MNTSSRLEFKNSSSAFSWLLLAAMSCFMATHSRAADKSAETPQPVAVVQVTLDQSMAVDKLVQKFYPNSPIAISVLRKALQDANPKIISGNPQQRVKAGSTLAVPEHGHIAIAVLTPFAAAHAAKNSDSDPTARDTAVRKPWVRFP
jgi:Tfp pilus assembly protein FimV